MKSRNNVNIILSILNSGLITRVLQVKTNRIADTSQTTTSIKRARLRYYNSNEGKKDSVLLSVFKVFQCNGMFLSFVKSVNGRDRESFLQMKKKNIKVSDPA